MAIGPLTERGGLGVLTAADLVRADACADTRLVDAKRLHARDRWGEDSRESHRWGARCEIAFARWANVEWECRSMSFKVGGDVAGIEVRKATQKYGLPLRADPVGRVVVAVVPDTRDLTCLIYDMPGWWRVTGREAEWTDNPGGRRAVPFVPIEQLERMVMFRWPEERV